MAATFEPFSLPFLRNSLSLAGTQLCSSENAFLACFNCGDSFRIAIATLANRASDDWQIEEISDALRCDEPCTPPSRCSAQYLPAFDSFLLAASTSSSLGLVRLTADGFELEDTTDEANCSVPMSEDFESECVERVACLWEAEREWVLYWTASGTLYGCAVSMDGARGWKMGDVGDVWREKEVEKKEVKKEEKVKEVEKKEVKKKEKVKEVEKEVKKEEKKEMEMEMECENDAYKKRICEWNAKEEAFDAFSARLAARPFASLEEEEKVALMLEESQLREDMTAAMLALKAELVEHRHVAMRLLQQIGDGVGRLARAVKPTIPYHMEGKKADLPLLLEAVKYLMCCRDLAKETASEEEKEE